MPSLRDLAYDGVLCTFNKQTGSGVFRQGMQAAKVGRLVGPAIYSSASVPLDMSRLLQAGR